jgi:ABC-type branched-subunit amino acid transport system substrate-binding protein
VVLVVLLVFSVLAGCTAPAPDHPAAGPTPLSPSPAPPEVPAGPRPITIAIVGGEDVGVRLDGVWVALDEVNRQGGVAGRPLAVEDHPTIPAALGARAAAVLVLGDAARIVSHRDAIQDQGRPVVLFGGDLYSARLLFREAFQTSPPVLWQARILARYATRDRGYHRVALLHEPGPEGRRARDAAVEAFARQGLDLDPVVASDEFGGPIRSAFRRADALMVVGGRDLATTASVHAAGMDDPPQLFLPSEALATDLDRSPPPGSVAVGPYTWAPWAEPIPRVRRFRARFEEAHDRLPAAAEQEGYDAIRVLADALEETDGRGGPALVRALEGFRPQGPVHSSLPVTLGPDEHVFSPELQLGLFAVSPEDPEPWIEGIPWRPLIRTFTYDGRRTLFLERDRRIFFPFWREGRPSPRFPRSRHGIVTRAEDDPLH